MEKLFKIKKVERRTREETGESDFGLYGRSHFDTTTTTTTRKKKRRRRRRRRRRRSAGVDLFLFFNSERERTEGKGRCESAPLLARYHHHHHHHHHHRLHRLHRDGDCKRSSAGRDGRMRRRDDNLDAGEEPATTVSSWFLERPKTTIQTTSLGYRENRRSYCENNTSFWNNWKNERGYRQLYWKS